MLLFVVVGLFILLLTSLLHYRQHFRLHLCAPNISSKLLLSASTIRRTNIAFTKDDIHANMNPISVSTQQLLWNNKSHRKCVCNMHLSSIDGEEFDFFPFSFFFYCVFMICLCIILISKWIVDDYSNSNPFSLDITESLHNNPDGIVSYILDYILIYGIMILSIWESLFSFYRYYTTKISSRTCRLVSMTRVLTRFIVYMIAFIIIFNIQIHFHVFYWIFPIIILLYSIFNIYCNLAFASILIVRYRHFLDINESTDNNNINKDILNSVYFMKRISLISNILSTCYLSIFFYFNNMNITYYLPILWSISCFIFSLNFIRNYKYIQQQIIFKCNRFISCCNCCNYFNSKTVKTSTNDDSTQIPSIEIRDGENIQNTDNIITQKKTNYERFNELIQNLHPHKRDGPALNTKSYSENNVFQELAKNDNTLNLRGKSISAHNQKRNKAERETLLLEELWDKHCEFDADDNTLELNNEHQSNPVPSMTTNISKHVAFNLDDTNKNSNKNSNKKQKAKSYDIQSKQSNKLKTRNLRLRIHISSDDESLQHTSTRSRGGKALEVLGLTPSNSMNSSINSSYYKERYLDATTHKSKSHGIDRKTLSQKMKLGLKGRSAKSEDSEYINMDNDESPGIGDENDENDEIYITPQPMNFDMNTMSDSTENKYENAVNLMDPTQKKNDPLRKPMRLKRKSLSNPILLRKEFFDSTNEDNTIQEEDSNIDQMFEMFDYSDAEEELVANLDFNTSSKRPLRNVVSAPNTMNGSHLKIPGLATLDIKEKDKSNDLSESGMVYTRDYDIDYDAKNELEATPDLITDDDNDDNDDNDEERKDNNDDTNNAQFDPYTNSQSKSKSKNIKNNKDKKRKSILEILIFGDNDSNKEESRDLDEMMMPLNLMAKHGLISTKSINSVQQIKMYQKNDNQRHTRTQSSLQIINTEMTVKPTLNLGFSAKQ